MSGWLARFDEDEAIFRKPLSNCLFFGAVAIGYAYFHVRFILPLYRGKPDEQSMFLLSVVMGLVVFLIFSFGAGPKVMRFDFRRQSYCYKIGFPFFFWKRSGDCAEIACIRVWDMPKFTGLSVEWKDAKRLQTTFVSCSTRQEAQALAERLGSKLCVRTEAGVARGVKKT